MVEIPDLTAEVKPTRVVPLRIPDPKTAVVLSPGDTLVLFIRDKVSPKDAASIKDHLKSYMPDVAFAVVSGVDQALVYCPTSPTGASL